MKQSYQQQSFENAEWKVVARQLIPSGHTSTRSAAVPDDAAAFDLADSILGNWFADRAPGTITITIQGPNYLNTTTAYNSSAPRPPWL